LQTALFRKSLTSFSVGLRQMVCSFVCDFIALEIMESMLTSHDDNFWKFHALYACTGDACALETRWRFVTEWGKKKSWNLNPDLTTWVISLTSRFTCTNAEFSTVLRESLCSAGSAINRTVSFCFLKFIYDLHSIDLDLYSFCQLQDSNSIYWLLQRKYMP